MGPKVWAASTYSPPGTGLGTAVGLGSGVALGIGVGLGTRVGVGGAAVRVGARVAACTRSVAEGVGGTGVGAAQAARLAASAAARQSQTPRPARGLPAPARSPLQRGLVIVSAASRYLSTPVMTMPWMKNFCATKNRISGRIRAISAPAWMSCGSLP